ncbi:MAG: DUF937 domain-containing protein [Dichotomicrobium sp.]
MSTNLVSMAMRYLTPDVIAKMASALGVGSNQINDAVSAEVPALFGSLAGVADKPGGASKLYSAVTRQDRSVLDNMPSTIEGSDQFDLAQNGLGTLKSLVGAAAVPSLATAISKFSGLGQGTSSSLLGMLAPVVLGLLGREQEKQGLDASGLARLTKDQAKYVAAAMPAGFADLLRSADIPGYPSAAMGSSYTAGSHRSGTSPAPRPAANVWTWLLPVAAVAAVALWFFSDRTDEVTEKQPDRIADTEAVATDVNPASFMVGGVNLKAAWDETFSELEATLRGVTDVASAQSALPELQSAGMELERIAELSQQLPAEGRQALAKAVNDAQPTLQELSDKVLAIPGISDIARERIELVRAQCDSLSKA